MNDKKDFIIKYRVNMEYAKWGWNHRMQDFVIRQNHKIEKQFKKHFGEEITNYVKGM